MACLSLVLFCLACFAGDVVELEPVRALDFHCSLLTTPGVGDLGQAACQASPFCFWDNPNCKDDPCLVASNRVLQNIDDTCAPTQGNSACDQKDVSASVLGHDCSGATPDTGILCLTTQAAAGKIWDYCAYAYIRDQKCPDSICKLDVVGCVRNNVQQCTMLSEKDCKLVPKCYYKNSQCLEDPCFFGSEDQTCADWTGAAGSGLTAGQCVDFKPLRTGTTSIQLYCLHKDNTNPNICYFAGKNESGSADDYSYTYPTYVPPNVRNPTCTGQISTCDGTGTCYTTINTGGALAGQYCTDGTHGSANVLRIPSILVFLVVSALSLFIL